MSFTPLVPFSGYSGWAFLKRTMPAQEEVLQKSAEVVRDEDYFRANIGAINTAEELVSDRRLLSVALGAYGLEDDIDNRFFIKKVLEGGTLDSSSLANKLTDTQYLAFSKAFGFGDYSVPRNKLSDFADKTLDLYFTRQFENGVTAQDETLGTGLTAERELATLSARSISNDTMWYTVMGSDSLRSVFEGALGLPSSFSSLDIDVQLSTFKEKANKVFGSEEVSQFTDPDKMESLVRKYILRTEALASFSSTSSASIALTLLQGGG
jgi:hypothetical protein